jgi:hypothetical protein
MRTFFFKTLAACSAGALFFLAAPAAYPADLPHHDITVSLDTEKHALSATDTITLPPSFPREFVFALHAGLNPASPDPAVRIEKKSDQRGGVPLELFKVTVPENAGTVTIRYSGSIDHPMKAAGKNQARGFEQTPGSIGAEGVYLDGGSGWYPLLETEFITFALTVSLPSRWDAVSQGRQMLHEKTGSATKTAWDSPEPQNEIYLIAAPFVRYEKKAGKLSAEVFLRTPEDELAGKYLDATIRYIDMYDKLIGPYPYAKFALVENFWETGFGMPSFTLLGPTVLRLPFIINTSYPHEILHNWWGNSVYPVYEKGNWSEGLTAYLADHLMKEQQGGGAEYRLNTLQKYADYVLAGRDFPLTQFTSRHSSATEAVGYGKALMFFHMLRRELGDKTFIAAVRNFYENYKFRFATFAEVRKSFEAASGRDLKKEFDQWVQRTGAPEIRLRETGTTRQGEGYRVKMAIEQAQPGDVYRLLIPVAVTMEGRDQAFQTVIELNERRRDLYLDVPSRPVRLDIDPEFDLFRRLARGEIPPAVSQALGAGKMLVLLPASAPRDLLNGYRAFAKSLAESGPDEVDIKLDKDIKNLPVDRAVAILGWENSFFQKSKPLWKEYDLSFEKETLRIGKNEFPRENHSVVLTGVSPGSREAVMLIASDRAAALPGLARKLPHYHKYSYLVFEGPEPANVAKDRWPVVNSPLTAFLPAADGGLSRAAMGKLAAREALASLPPVFSGERMMETVKYLSGDDLQGREIGTPEIDRAADYIRDRFKEAGLMPGGDNGSYFQTWKEQNIPPLTKGGTGEFLMKNVIGILPGKKRDFAGQSAVLGAHYDHLGLGMSIGTTGDRGKIHPGADDNASGVAVLLELARTMKETLNPDRSIVFVAFTGEEEGKLGSGYYVGNEKQYPASKCIGMVNLDTVGRLEKRKLLVLGSGSAREWVHIFRGAGFVTGVDIEIVSQDLDSSDQKSFQRAGVPAVQLFSGPTPDYHRPSDTADKIDSAGLVKVASVTKEVIEYLASREEPLTITLKPGEAPRSGSKERKVGLGTIPDYAYGGKGVRLSGVMEGSAAAEAGLKEGDVITSLNSSPVSGLKDFSDFLKTLKPGDKITITYLRDQKERTIETTVRAR